jgi:hypothetical protein
MTITARRPRYSLSFKASRDWPLAAAALSALLSFAMLFPPWLSSGAGSANAFGDALQAAGPALIIVMAFATIILLAVAAATAGRTYVKVALVPSSVLLALYVVKVADVSDLANLYNRLAASFTSARIVTGIGLWLGFVFALLTELFVLCALAFQWGRGDALVYPDVRALRKPRRDTSPETGTSADAVDDGEPPPPDHPPGPAP